MSRKIDFGRYCTTTRKDDYLKTHRIRPKLPSISHKDKDPGTPLQDEYNNSSESNLNILYDDLLLSDSEMSDISLD